MIIRCSSLPTIMKNPRSKAAIERGEMGESAKSEVKKLVREQLFDFTSIVSTKEMQKGIECEDRAIELVNSILFKEYKKNTERKRNDYITGECDIDTGDEIIDIKCSWSKKTFPASPGDIKINDYEWQLRGYMMLWERPNATVCYCLVDTPGHLRPTYESDSIHDMGNIEEQLRISMFTIFRDEAKEQQIIDRINNVNEFAKEYKNEILLKSESYFQ